MKIRVFLVLLTTIVLSCSNSVDYSDEFKKETSGSYLYNLDDLIEVYYDDNTLYLNWRGGKVKPVAIAENEFFVPDMYKKYHFVIHPETKKRYLSAINEDEASTITYDYLKAPKGYKTPSTLLEEGKFKKALAGYLEIKKQDSTSSYINEWDFNKLGYKYFREQELEKAIEVFKINVALHPTSANVYDSLGQAYLVSGDSLQAYINYKNSLKFNNGNKRAKEYVDAYKTKS
ncbi:tetratricopeptide repeat protein [Winogradskyella sp. PE311]|uniref:tetratricopeptide repeat protein n=1 Tax=Winogradskyella sp. PE311 TaxID=3366943 RepID=UPI00397EDA9D